MEELTKVLRNKLESLDNHDKIPTGSVRPVPENLAQRYMTRFPLLPSSEKQDFPSFYNRPPSKDDFLSLFLKAKVHEEGREMVLLHKHKDLFNEVELTELYLNLERKASPPVDVNGEKFISYKDFMKLMGTSNEKTTKLLDASTFMKLLTDDPFGRVSITVLFSFIMRKVWVLQTRIGLAFHDDGQGFLNEHGLETYILELIPTLVQLGGMDKSFESFYVCTAVRKFFFFLDPNKTGRIKIVDILCSGLIDDLLDLRETDPPKPLNWFSIENTMKAYGNYLNLDTDHNGMLAPKELIKYSAMSMTLTPAFIERVFQECLTFKGEMDYRTYLDFVLAIENPKEVQSIQYFFRILDIDHKGYLDAFTLHYFYKDILSCADENGADKVPFQDVKDEIFDMVKPKDPFKITAQDLIRSGKGDTVIALLTDFQGFWAYENRETLAADMKMREQQLALMTSEV